MKYLLSFFLLFIASSALAAQTVRATIHTSHGETPLMLELATTPQTRAQGLMHRDSLTPNDGMLFIFPHSAPMAFWMKNTRISLDMLFINTQGKIMHIAAQTTPYSESPIDSHAAVNQVIELAGGQAAAHHIQTGDSVIYQLPEGTHVE